jgi:anti-sigma regulatory factor (Ser/Thr protein kinase)
VTLAGAREITRPARAESLAGLLGFLDGAIAGAGLDGATANEFRLAAEEVCSNVIAHAYPDGAAGFVTLRLAREPAAFVVTVEDAGIPFDPAAAPAPRLDVDWEQRPLGGLGWHLVRQVMDEVRHEPLAGGGNRVTLVKHLPVPS